MCRRRRPPTGGCRAPSRDLAPVSVWVDAAMEEKARREDLAALLAEMKTQNGPATDDEQAWARAVLGL